MQTRVLCVNDRGGMCSSMSVFLHEFVCSAVWVCVLVEFERQRGTAEDLKSEAQTKGQIAMVCLYPGGLELWSCWTWRRRDYVEKVPQVEKKREQERRIQVSGYL